MAEENVTRKLTAILYADVAGYSRLTGEDEVGTHKQLSAGLDLISQRIGGSGGRVVHYAGDAVLADFGSVVAAVDCAVRIQRQFAENNAQLPDDKRLQFRIGVNLGEVIVDRDDIYGDGVNVAARLEGLAEPGGVCLSDAVLQIVKAKLDLPFEDLGERALKNIAEPVRVYRVPMGSDEGRIAPMESRPRPSSKPAIAVLPFQNMSADPEQEYFSDGITEDIITALARYRSFYVVARNSTFAFKDRASDVRATARELGARYVLEGSVRKLGNRVRISAQLVKASDGNHIWADRYDRELADIFALQDEMARTIAATIEPELSEAEGRIAQSKPLENLDAWDCYQQGLWHMYRFTEDGLTEAKRLFERALDLDPGFAIAHARLAYAHIQLSWYGPHESRDQRLEQALVAARQAVALDDKDGLGHFALGRVYALEGRRDLAIAELEMAIRLNPSLAQAYFGLGQALGFAGRYEDAVTALQEAIRLSPHDPHQWTFLHVLSLVYFGLGRLEEAETLARTSVQKPNATHWPFATLTSILGHLGKCEEVVPVRQELLTKMPEYSCSFARDDFTFLKKPLWGEAHLDMYVTGLRKAGLPE